MAAKKDGDMLRTFQQRKKGSSVEPRISAFKKDEGSTGGKGSVGPNRQQQNAAAAPPVNQSAPFEEDDVELVLREFDLEAKFGPCLGMTRMERWQRAHRLGLSPPQVVHDFLEHAGGSQNCMWHNRV
eukprot:TRINITY_DN1844_c0_g2_i1.p2 TRINITY_DN1844_c0_g2~~TRINITY_DN1844_c0_g2_i1.p2  ORF type:complete len:127 (-),score=38.20 TRINITY_DN1844_c0_g2_i1:256-636(-)